MIIDSSAIIAILFGEPESEDFVGRMASARCRMSTANWLESAMRLEGVLGAGAGPVLDGLVDELSIVLEPVTVEHATAARIAFRRYGKGSGSPAELTFGDCLAYALSATSGEPLLFKGDDFTHTDILSVR
ncbi:type II toxin-antitoxin system VapC family toxin [Nocardioides sp. L-11A]|uniref:type II toxin-antitoxin system VapC family toxin n=1 Tax=Nocardioides sp. L-11A TaxID=3043848 RepID=UPI00249C6FA2|nr:type II toxin-antitoxin system VapC family toxin [Nocardioides sp. L-11A]